MITLQVNLENEQLLHVSIEKIFESLSDEKKEELAEKALFKYLTDTVDYGHKQFVDDKLKEVKKIGIRSGSNYYNKTVDELSRLTDEQILDSDGFRQIEREYVSPKNARFKEINKLLDTKLIETINTFVKSNNDLENMIAEKGQALKEHFPEIVSNVLSTIGYNFILKTVEEARFGPNANYGINQITEILTRNNIR